jgi:site-specific DNA-methyltransferase (adenine-specific)
MAMCEYAWTSFNENAKYFEFAPQGRSNEKRFHPTQKPVALYAFCLRHFAKPGDKILDTHAGSGSCLVAAHQFGHPWMGFELDPDYCRLAQERIDRAMAQGRLFDPPKTEQAASELSLLKAAGL